MANLGLCDVSPLPKLSVKGPGADPWLRERGIQTPATVLEIGTLPDGGVTARIGTVEFFVESGPSAESVPLLDTALGAAPSGVFRVERQDATFVLAGAQVQEALAQTCGINFREAPEGRVILTSVAGVSCIVLPQRIAEVDAYRLWVEPSGAVYLWQTLATIVSELGGGLIGAASVYPELATSRVPSSA